MRTQDTPEQALVTTTPPAMVLSRGPHGPWRVEKMIPALAEAVTNRADAGIGRSVERVFEKASPPVQQIADQCLAEGGALEVPVKLLPELPLLTAKIRSYGLSDDYQRQQLAFWFSETEGATPQTERFHQLVGQSRPMQTLFEKIRLYAPSDAAVVITGETGTGKELVARALHEESPRSQRPFVAINCSAISDELLESELFGHEKGAFTGAVRAHKGRFERADGGTLFLDEIGDMPLHTQAKLLRVLEEGVIERVGAESEIAIDVRIACATNVPLEEAVYQGNFRADLYHRLAVLRLHLPALRERNTDIPALVDHFLQLFSERYQRTVERLTPEAIALLQAYQWPGNIRELRNVLERVFIESQTAVIGARAFSDWIQERQAFAPGEWGQAAPKHAPPIAPPYRPHEQQLLLTSASDQGDAPSSGRGIKARLSAEDIRQAYQQAGGNLTHAARQLGVHRATLYRHMQRLGLHRDNL